MNADKPLQAARTSLDHFENRIVCSSSLSLRAWYLRLRGSCQCSYVSKRLFGCHEAKTALSAFSEPVMLLCWSVYRYSKDVGTTSGDAGSRPGGCLPADSGPGEAGRSAWKLAMISKCGTAKCSYRE